MTTLIRSGYSNGKIKRRVQLYFNCSTAQKKPFAAFLVFDFAIKKRVSKVADAETFIGLLLSDAHRKSSLPLSNNARC